MSTTEKPIQKVIDYYPNLPWSYTIEQATDESNRTIYIVRVNELPDVVTDALSIEEAMESVKKALTLALEISLKSGEEIPKPMAKASEECCYGRHIPNEETLQAMREAEQGIGLIQCTDAEDLFKKLKLRG
jgi:predicted RNase H-like HicB family nuclease